MHKKFNYKTLSDVQKDFEAHGLNLGVSDDARILTQPVRLDQHLIANALVAHPMEGGDADAIGAPTDVTFRKYERVARGGVGLIWLESVSISYEGRSNRGQLYIHDDTLNGFKELIQRIHNAAEASPIALKKPVVIMQINHSGRYSKPEGPPQKAPMIASYKPELDAQIKLPEDHPLVTDEYLDALIDQFVKASVLAKEAGFDGVDIKACHGYLLHETLSCYDRTGKYGGSFENRTNLMLTIIDAVKTAVDDPDFIIASRLNIYDALTESLGFGMNANDFSQVDMTEPIRLTKELVMRGVKLINITMGNPVFIPHINRPYDSGAYVPPESPLTGVYRLIDHARALQEAVPDAVIVGTGYTWLREFSPQVAAWVMQTGGAKMIGYGRQFIAYPDFARDIIENNTLTKSKCCVCCSKCSFLKRDVGKCGCPVKDAAAYLPLYLETYQNN